MVNTKHVSHYSVPFYGKLIITSNNEDKFSKVDNEEIRYWVRKVPTLKGKANHNILEDMSSAPACNDLEGITNQKVLQCNITSKALPSKVLRNIFQTYKPKVMKTILKNTYQVGG